MKLLLDTTYLLPAIGISIRELAKDALIKLMQKGHQISISEISIFELSAKGAKHVATGTLPAERVVRGIRAIVYDERVEIVPIYDGKLLLTSFEIRNMLNDYVDCIITSSAMNQSDALITEDNDILSLEKNKKFNELVASTNSKFKIHQLADIL